MEHLLCVCSLHAGQLINPNKLDTIALQCKMMHILIPMTVFAVARGPWVPGLSWWGSFLFHLCLLDKTSIKPSKHQRHQVNNLSGHHPLYLCWKVDTALMLTSPLTPLPLWAPEDYAMPDTPLGSPFPLLPSFWVFLFCLFSCLFYVFLIVVFVVCFYDMIFNFWE